MFPFSFQNRSIFFYVTVPHSEVLLCFSALPYGTCLSSDTLLPLCSTVFKDHMSNFETQGCCYKQLLMVYRTAFVLIYFSVYFWKRVDLPKIALFMLILEFLPQNVKWWKRYRKKSNKNVSVTAFLNLWAEHKFFLEQIEKMRKSLLHSYSNRRSYIDGAKGLIFMVESSSLITITKNNFRT